MLVEKLKDISEVAGWQFNYGADHWQNLQDLPDDTDLEFSERQKYLMLLWKDRDFILNDYSAITGCRFDGEMVLCVRSKIQDPDYNFKYEEYIKHLESETEKMFDAFSVCDDWTVKAWRETEVSNQYDTNIDGLKIKFTMTYEGQRSDI